VYLAALGDHRRFDIIVVMFIFRHGHSFLLLFLLMGLAAAFQSPLRAQAISGDLIGAALDVAGAPIPSASITLTNPETGLEAARTDENQQLRREVERLTEDLRKADIVIDIPKKVAALLGRPILPADPREKL
jgi:hypothetical protein